MNVRIVGYSADDELIHAFKSFIHTVANPKKPLWHKYSFRGEIRFYKHKLELIDEAIVTYLGLAHEPTYDNWKASQVNKVIVSKKNKCCYCGCKLTIPQGNCKGSDKTVDHVIPRHKGGKTTLPCCYSCNQEKGGLMLHSYIQMLNILCADMTLGTPEYILTQTKIINANEIAKSISLP